jgi:hypothetical protein
LEKRTSTRSKAIGSSTAEAKSRSRIRRVRAKRRASAEMSAPMPRVRGHSAASLAAASLWLGAAARYAIALFTPGESGRRLRLRYRAALRIPRA